MKKFLPVFVLFIFACTSSHRENPKEDENDYCTYRKYDLIWHINIWDAGWKSQYFEYIVNCEKDTHLLKTLAKLDADHGNYTFIIYGLIGDLTPFENVFKRHPIGFHTAGCDAPEMGELYNREVKRLLKQNEGLDYDSVMKVEFAKQDSVIQAQSEVYGLE